MIKATSCILTLLLMAMAVSPATAAKPKQPGDSFEELGLVAWRLDKETAQAEAERTGKPLMFSCARFVVARTDQQARIARDVLGEDPAQRVVRSNDRICLSNPDTKYQLRRHPNYFFLPLTEIQATRLNSALGGIGPNPETYLSPTQKDLLARLNRLTAKELKGLKLESRRSNMAIAEYAATLKRELKRIEPQSTAGAEASERARPYPVLVAAKTRADRKTLAELERPGKVVFRDGFESPASLKNYFEIRGLRDGRAKLITDSLGSTASSTFITTDSVGAEQPTCD